ncbi:EamA family transporter [Carboxylicivirga mesophila]|uniref:EamA family transporter n=1 Tax=Carboxylicivirga mesophila TaxID=1166478 RepID=A0ABS5KB27_9BACT|nr:EamA family transporter [Carboxylicivirga mesophila]MBS2212233.1 EamA family transporter [Carboxylicivirga mesophila]
MTNINKKLITNYTKLHFVVILYGFTAILGKLITLPAPQMVWYRMIIAFLVLGGYLWYKKMPIAIGTVNILKLMGIGLVVAFHWITFFHAVKISNVSVTLGCMASTTLFASFLEPIIFRKRIKWVEVLIGLVIILGLYLIFQFELTYWKGIITALISAFLAGLFTVLNKIYIDKYHPVTISFYEMLSGFISIGIFLMIIEVLPNNLLIPTNSDIIYILILGIVCTAYAFVVAVDVMKVLSAYTVVLAINMEPVYGILLAFFIFGQSEFMSAGFYLGTLVILAAVFLHPILLRFQKKQP